MTEINQLRLTEIFYSIQGESAAAGRPCVFVRLSRCNLRCRWCDTTYSFKGGDMLSFDELFKRVEEYGCDLVELTGGEPLLQPAVHPFMSELCERGYEVLIETSGSLDISPIDPRVTIIMDLKAPGSGEVEKNLWDNIEHLKASDEVKFVVADRVDFDWAAEVLREYRLDERVNYVHFSPVYEELKPEQLAEWMLAEKIPGRLNLQIHKYLGVE